MGALPSPDLLSRSQPVARRAVESLGLRGRSVRHLVYAAIRDVDTNARAPQLVPADVEGGGLMHVGGGEPEDRFVVEVEADCFDIGDGLMVALAITNFEGQARQGGGLAWLAPETARTIADALAKCADEVEACAVEA